MFIEPFPSVRNFYERCSDPVYFSCGAELMDKGFKSLTRPPPKKDGPTSRTPNEIPAYIWRTSLQLLRTSASRLCPTDGEILDSSTSQTAVHENEEHRTLSGMSLIF